MRLLSTLIVCIVFLHLNGMERPYPLDVDRIIADFNAWATEISKLYENEKLREHILREKDLIVQMALLFNEKHSQSDTNARLQIGFVTRQIGEVHKSVEGVDIKVDRLSDTIEDSTVIAKARIKSIEAQLLELNEHAVEIKAQSTNIAQQIQDLRSELIAAQTLIDKPLNMAQSDPGVKKATSSPRETIPLGGSPRRDPKDLPFNKQPKSDSSSSPHILSKKPSKEVRKTQGTKKKKKKKKSSRGKKIADNK